MPPEPDLLIPAVDGLLSAADIRATGESIAELQLPSGQIPWYPGGHCDPWNHVETAMALDVVGLHDEAERAYQWLVDIQHDDGAWHQYYLGDGVDRVPALVQLLDGEIGRIREKLAPFKKSGLQ